MSSSTEPTNPGILKINCDEKNSVVVNIFAKFPVNSRTLGMLFVTQTRNNVDQLFCNNGHNFVDETIYVIKATIIENALHPPKLDVDVEMQPMSTCKKCH